MTPEEQIAQVLSGWFAEHLTYESFRTTSDGDLAAGAAAVLIAAGIGVTADAKAEALAPLENLFAGGPDTVCRTLWREAGGGWPDEECVIVPMDDLRAAFAAAHPEQPVTGE